MARVAGSSYTGSALDEAVLPADRQASESQDEANSVIGMIEKAGYVVYTTHHSGLVLRMLQSAGASPVVVGHDKSGSTLAAAIQAAAKLGLDVPARPTG